MKITVYGTGAVGGHIAGRLGAVGAHVSVIARGGNLTAITENGLRVETREGTLTSFPVATDHPETLEPQDIVVVVVKAPSLPEIGPGLRSLLHDGTRVVFVTNGIPWWYFQSLEGPLANTRLPLLDPDDLIWNSVGPERTVGGVAYTAGTIIAPGVIRAENPSNRLVIGRPDGKEDGELDRFAALLSPSGLETTVTPTIRDAVWAKLISNTVGGALGTLTGSPTKDVLDKPALAAAASAMADEVASAARALGSDPGDVAPIVAKLATSGHVQSIVQDLLAGRRMEVDALFQAPLELARLAGTATPNLELVVELAVQRARAAGLYHDSVGR